VLPQENRLALRKELHRLQKKGRIAHFPLFSLLIGQNQTKVSRFGFIISKKIDKRAVRRNRIKRLLREAIRCLLPQIEKGYDVVFLVKKGIARQDYQTILLAVKKALKRECLLLKS